MINDTYHLYLGTYSRINSIDRYIQKNMKYRSWK